MRVAERHAPLDQPLGDVGREREALRRELGHPLGVEAQRRDHARERREARPRGSRTESKTGSLSSCRSRLYASGRPLSVASRPVRLPISRPALPRASSAMSGFFFCGMMLDPVE